MKTTPTEITIKTPPATKKANQSIHDALFNAAASVSADQSETPLTPNPLQDMTTPPQELEQNDLIQTLPSVEESVTSDATPTSTGITSPQIYEIVRMKYRFSD
jgi:hypothetical protein